MLSSAGIRSAASSTGKWKGIAEGLQNFNNSLAEILRSQNADDLLKKKQKWDEEQERRKQDTIAEEVALQERRKQDTIAEEVALYERQGYTHDGAVLMAAGKEDFLTGTDRIKLETEKAKANAAGETVKRDAAETAADKQFSQTYPDVAGVIGGDPSLLRSSRLESAADPELFQRRRDELASVPSAGPSTLTMPTPAMRTPTGGLSAADILSGRGGSSPRLMEPRLPFTPKSGGVVPEQEPFKSIPKRLAEERQTARGVKQQTTAQQLRNAEVTGKKTEQDIAHGDTDETRKQWEHDQAVGKAARELREIPEFVSDLLPLVADGNFEEAADAATALLNVKYAADARGNTLRASINDWRARAAMERQEFEAAIKDLPPENQRYLRAAKETGATLPVRAFEGPLDEKEATPTEAKLYELVFGEKWKEAWKQEWTAKLAKLRQDTSGQGGESANERLLTQKLTRVREIGKTLGYDEEKIAKYQMDVVTESPFTQERFLQGQGFRNAAQLRTADEAMQEIAKSFRTDLYRQFKQDATLSPFVQTDGFGNPIALRQGADVGKVLGKLRSVAAGFDKQIPEGVIAEVGEITGRGASWVRNAMTGSGIEVYEVPVYTPPAAQKGGAQTPGASSSGILPLNKSIAAFERNYQGKRLQGEAARQIVRGIKKRMESDMSISDDEVERFKMTYGHLIGWK